MHRVCINTYFHISSVHFHVFGNLTQFCRSMKVLLAKEKERNQIICLKFSHSLIVSVCPSSHSMPIYFMHVLLYIRCSIRILINATNLKYWRFMANNKIVHSKQDLASLNRNAWECNNQKYQQIFLLILSNRIGIFLFKQISLKISISNLLVVLRITDIALKLLKILVNINYTFTYSIL